MNGYEAARRIRMLNNKLLSNIPIIALTANAFEEDRIKALEAGMNDFVAKPIDVKKLMDALEDSCA
jgi:CheY-like chemotaxis protein